MLRIIRWLKARTALFWLGFLMTSFVLFTLFLGGILLILALTNTAIPLGLDKLALATLGVTAVLVSPTVSLYIHRQTLGTSPEYDSAPESGLSNAVSVSEDSQTPNTPDSLRNLVAVIWIIAGTTAVVTTFLAFIIGYIAGLRRERK